MRRRSAFTLVELVVVVLILGILAAVAAPKIINNSTDAGDSGISQTLATIRDALEMYKIQSGIYPGGTSAAIQGALGQYIRGSSFPKVNVGGVTNNSDILVDTTNDPPAVNTGGGEGWVYNPNVGEIRINSDVELASQSGSGIKYSDL